MPGTVGSLTAGGSATSATVYFTPADRADYYTIGVFKADSAGNPVNMDGSGNPTDLPIIYTCGSSMVRAPARLWTSCSQPLR